jgi:threonine/homoserine/homoserine lactone efflux protein
VGLACGLGAATADACYGCIAAFGLTLVSSFMIHEQIWLHLLGGVFLMYLGIRTVMGKPSTLVNEDHPQVATGAYASTFLLTLTNPDTILSFMAVFAGLGAVRSRDYPTAALLVIGIFLGSAMWWLLLSSGVGKLRDRLSPRSLSSINWLSGTILLGFGCFALASVVGL